MEDRTILAIDYGTKRIGLAKSDPMAIIASALKTIDVKSDSEAIKLIAEVLNEYTPRTIVIGYPLLASGDKSKKCEEIDRFIEKLSSVFSGPIIRVDEANTSREAASIVRAHGQKVRKDKSRLDRLAAVLILQRYLEEQSAS
jgi:putative Holliday junction resolvase